MTDNTARFAQAILANPEDEQLRLVMADTCEEAGNQQIAEALRGPGYWTVNQCRLRWRYSLRKSVIIGTIKQIGCQYGQDCSMASNRGRRRLAYRYVYGRWACRLCALTLCLKENVDRMENAGLDE